MDAIKAALFSRITQILLASVVMPLCVWAAGKLNAQLDPGTIATIRADAVYLIGAGLAAAWAFLIHYRENGVMFIHPSTLDAKISAQLTDIGAGVLDSLKPKPPVD
jgi:hypothetical protein